MMVVYSENSNWTIGRVIEDNDNSGTVIVYNGTIGGKWTPLSLAGGRNIKKCFTHTNIQNILSFVLTKSDRRVLYQR